MTQDTNNITSTTSKLSFLDTMKVFFYGFIACLVCMAVIVFFCHPWKLGKQSVNPTHVTETTANTNTGKQQNKPTINEQQTGTVETFISVKPNQTSSVKSDSSKSNSGSSNVNSSPSASVSDSATGQPTPIPGTTPDVKPVLALTIGDNYSAPASITLKTNYFDITGKPIGTGQRTFTGETDVAVEKDGLDIKTSFTDSVNLVVDIPGPPPKVWHVGFYASTSGDFKQFSLGGYGQRDFYLWQTKRVDVKAFGRVEKDWEWRGEAGIDFSF